jgi:hypothetical protein
LIAANEVSSVDHGSERIDVVKERLDEDIPVVLARQWSEDGKLKEITSQIVLSRFIEDTFIHKIFMVNVV